MDVSVESQLLSLLKHPELEKNFLFKQLLSDTLSAQDQMIPVRHPSLYYKHRGTRGSSLIVLEMYF